MTNNQNDDDILDDCARYIRGLVLECTGEGIAEEASAKVTDEKPLVPETPQRWDVWTESILTRAAEELADVRTRIAALESELAKITSGGISHE